MHICFYHMICSMTKELRSSFKCNTSCLLYLGEIGRIENLCDHLKIIMNLNTYLRILVCNEPEFNEITE